MGFSDGNANIFRGTGARSPVLEAGSSNYPPEIQLDKLKNSGVHTSSRLDAAQVRDTEPRSSSSPPGATGRRTA